MSRFVTSKLKDRLDLLIIAVGAQGMRGFSSLETLAQRIHESTRGKRLKRVTLEIHYYLFKSHQFFFEIGFRAMQRLSLRRDGYKSL